MVIIVGLPASGKSTEAKRRAQEMNIPDAQIFDDFKLHRRLRSPSFHMSAAFPALKRALLAGKGVIVVDIDFCDSKSRIDAICALHRVREDIDIEWVFFENDPDQCLINVMSDHTHTQLQASERPDYIRKYASRYQIPPTAKPLKVWQAPT